MVAVFGERSVKLHEFWRHEYDQDRYLSHLSNVELSGRIRYLMENLTTLETNGKIGLKNIQIEPARTLMRKFTHSHQELTLRNREPEPMFLKGASIPDAMLGHETRLKELNEYAIKKKPHLIKFGKKQHFEEFSFKVSLASSFVDPSLNTAQMDDEMRAIYHPHPDDIKITTQDGQELNGVARLELIREAAKDYYIFCSSASFDVRLFGDFNADSCLFIYDYQSFSDELFGKVSEKIPISCHAYKQVSYVDPIRPDKGDPPPVEFHKHMKYLYQDEFRHVFNPNNNANNPKDLFLVMPESKRYTELVSL